MAWFKYFKSTESIDSATPNYNYSYPYCKRFIDRFTPRDTIANGTWIFANISDVNINTYKDTSLDNQTDDTSYLVVYEKGQNIYPVETVIEGNYLYFKTYESHTAAEEIVGQYAIYYNTPNLRKVNQVDNAGTDDYQVNLAPVWESIELDPFIYGETYNDLVSAVGTIYSISLGSLPDGITINSSNGAVSGTVNETGDYSFTIRATTDDGKYYNEASFSGTIQEIPSWIDNALVNVDYNSPYSDSVWADGVPTPIYSISSGALPDGITLDTTTGALTGTSTDSGAYSFIIKAENIYGSVTQSFSGTVQTPPSWSDQTLGIITKASAYSDGVSATGTSPITYSVYSGSLPSSITLNTSTGAITGTTAASGSYSFTIRATNSWGYVEKAFSGTIYEVPAWTDSSIANMIYGQAYSDGVTASGYPAVTYSVSAGALPSGITLNSSTGAITGTSSTAGSYSFTIKAENAAGSVTQMFTDSLFVTPSWTDNTLAAFTYNTAYSDGVSATGSPTYTISSGSLPTGLSLNSSSGAVTGTPTYYGAYSFQIKAENETGSVTQNFSGAIYRTPFWTDSTLPTPTYNVSYSNGVTADGYDTAMYYGISSGSLPSGFSLNSSTGAVTGTYTAPIYDSSFTFNFTIRATNSVGYVEQAFTWVIAVPFSASGGTVTTSGGYTIHTFTSSGNFTVNSGSKSVEYIVVGGGGGGGDNTASNFIWSGGGGAGGLRTGTTTLSAGYYSSSNYALAVGAGGAVNAEGNYSTMNIISSPGYVYCVGGGRGGGWSSGAVSGGSGGGGWGTTGSSGSGASGTSSEGNSGGNGAIGGGGGGGGKGSTGSNGNGSTNAGGNGGTGQTFTWGSSLDGYLSGGGGGAGFSGAGSGGNSVGGSGARLDYYGNLINATSGTANKGSGGGGAASSYNYNYGIWQSANGGSGSSGCVIVRYLT